MAVTDDQKADRLATIARLREMIGGIDASAGGIDPLPEEPEPVGAVVAAAGPVDVQVSGAGGGQLDSRGWPVAAESFQDVADDSDELGSDKPELGDDSVSSQITDPEKARQIALRCLNAQERTAYELKQILRRKHVVEPVAQTIVDRFVEVGLLNDRDFARQWVATRQVSKSASRSRLRRELAVRGIAPALITEALNQASLPEAEVALALARKRAVGMSGLSREKAMRRLISQLERRGFTPAVVRSTVVQVVDEMRSNGNIAADE